MWKYNYTISPDELYHHKYIAKIGSGKNARDQKSHNNNDYDELKRASDNYKEAKTVKGKVNAARKVFNQYHPETAKRINKGRKKLRKILGY